MIMEGRLGRNFREKGERNIVENLERESSNENEYFGTFCP
jgi:hypothetical protein